MTSALLITNNAYMRAEFDKIIAVTGFSLEVTAQPDVVQINNAQHIFLDPECSDFEMNHRMVWIVTSGPAGPTAWQCAARVNAQRIVSLPQDRSEITQALTKVSSRRARVTAFIPLVGGAGASTLAACVAGELSRISPSVVLIDCQSRGGGMAVMLGTERATPTTWHDLITADPHSFSMERLSSWNSLHYLPAPIGIKNTLGDEHIEIIKAIAMESTQLVLDCSSLDQMRTLEGLVDDVCLVVPNTLRAVALARASIEEFDSSMLTMGVVVRSVPGSALAEPLVAQTLELPLWASIPTDTRLVEVIEQGLGPVALRNGSHSRAISRLANYFMDQEVELRAA